MKHHKPHQGNWPNPWSPMLSPMEQWVWAVRAWADMLSAFVPGVCPQPCDTGEICPPNPCQEAAPPISVRISSARPVEVAASLIPGAETMPLVAHVPHLHGIQVLYESGHVCIYVRVAADHPAGVFEGEIMAHGREVGELTVTILDPDEKKA